MLNIKIIAIGKIKEKFFQEAIKEYIKRLNRFCKLEIIELIEEKIPDNASKKEEENIKNMECERILSKIKDKDFVICLSPSGKKLSSENFASFINKESINGTNSFVFVIGGSLGISDNALKKANLILSFSDMTFPHQLFRIILLEQIYRSFKINSNETYHK